MFRSTVDLDISFSKQQGNWMKGIKNEIVCFKDDLKQERKKLYSGFDKIKVIAYDIMKNMEDRESLRQTMAEVKCSLDKINGSMDPIHKIIEKIESDPIIASGPDDLDPETESLLSQASNSIRDLYLATLPSKGNVKLVTSMSDISDCPRDPIKTILEYAPKIASCFQVNKKRWDEEKRQLHADLDQYRDEIHSLHLKSNESSFELQKNEELSKALNLKISENQSLSNTIKDLQEQLKLQHEIIQDLQTKENINNLRDTTSSPINNIKLNSKHGSPIPYDERMDIELDKTDKAFEELLSKTLGSSSKHDKTSNHHLEITFESIIRTMERLMSQLEMSQTINSKDLKDLRSALISLKSTNTTSPVKELESEVMALRNSIQNLSNGNGGITDELRILWEKETEINDRLRQSINENGHNLLRDPVIKHADPISHNWNSERSHLQQEVRGLKNEITNSRKKFSELIREKELAFIEQEKALRTALTVQRDEFEKKCTDFRSENEDLKIQLENFHKEDQESLKYKTMTEALEMEIESLQVTLNEKSSKVDELTKFQNLQSERMKQAETLIPNLENQISQLQKENRALQREHEKIKYHFDVTLKELENSNAKAIQLVETEKFNRKFLPPPIIVEPNSSNKDEKDTNVTREKLVKAKKRVKKMEMELKEKDGELSSKEDLIKSLQKELDKISVELTDCIMGLRDKDAIIHQLRNADVARTRDLRMLSEKNFMMSQQPGSGAFQPNMAESHLIHTLRMQLDEKCKELVTIRRDRENLESEYKMRLAKFEKESREKITKLEEYSSDKAELKRLSFDLKEAQLKLYELEREYTNFASLGCGLEYRDIKQLQAFRYQLINQKYLLMQMKFLSCDNQRDPRKTLKGRVIGIIFAIRLRNEWKKATSPIFQDTELIKKTFPITVLDVQVRDSEILALKRVIGQLVGEKTELARKVTAVSEDLMLCKKMQADADRDLLYLHQVLEGFPSSILDELITRRDQKGQFQDILKIVNNNTA